QWFGHQGTGVALADHVPDQLREPGADNSRLRPPRSATIASPFLGGDCHVIRTVVDRGGGAGGGFICSAAANQRSAEPVSDGRELLQAARGTYVGIDQRRRDRQGRHVDLGRRALRRQQLRRS